MQTIFDRCTGMKWHSLTDLALGFNQIKLSKEAQRKLALVTEAGMVKQLRMGFGLKQGPAFSKCIRTEYLDLWVIVMSS